jgi:hypothetical protein
MVHSYTLAIAADGEHLSCSGFSLGEAIRFGSLNFFTDCFGGRSLCPIGTVQMPPSWAEPAAGHHPHRVMIGDSTKEFHTTINVLYYTHTILHIACITTVKPTTAQKIASYFSNPKERWSKTPTSLCNSHHPERSITPRSASHTTSNILHLTLRCFRHKSTKQVKDKLWPLINSIIMPQPTTHSLHQLHK